MCISLAITFNSDSTQAARVVANFMLSPEAQIRKADPAIWGDPSVLSQGQLSEEDAAAFAALPKGMPPCHQQNWQRRCLNLIHHGCQN